MPAIAAKTIALTTPVVRSFAFEPQSIIGNLSTFIDQTNDIPAAYSKLTGSISRPSKTSKNTRSRIRLEIPVMDSATGLIVTDTMIADLTVTCGQTTALNDREVLAQAFLAVLGTSGTGMLDDLVVTQKQYY